MLKKPFENVFFYNKDEKSDKIRNQSQIRGQHVKKFKKKNLTILNRYNEGNLININ